MILNALYSIGPSIVSLTLLRIANGVTILGDFSKNQGDFFKKSSINVYKVFGFFENITFQAKTVLTTFWAFFVKIWDTFYFSIWSH